MNNAIIAPAWLKIFHPGPSIATTAAAILFAFALRVPLDYLVFVLVAIGLPMLLVQLSISVLNDWADRDGDRRSGHANPISAGSVPPNVALVLASAMAIGAFIASVFAGDGPLPTAILMLGWVCGVAYDLWLKPTPLSFVPFAVAFPLMLVWIREIVNFGPPTPLIFAAGAPLAIAIHLADSIEDQAADARAGRRTLAVVLDRSASTIAAGGLALGTAVIAALTMPAHLPVALFILALGLGASGAVLAGLTSRWIVAPAALLMTVAWLAVGGW